jgi:peptidoglycan hydrolase CwlO-like protein
MQEYMGQFVVGLILYILAATVAAIKANSKMQEQIKTLYKQVEQKDQDIKNLENKFVSLSDEIKSLRSEIQEGNANIVNMIHELHIKVVESKNEA